MKTVTTAITSSFLKPVLATNDYQIIDIRSPDAFNGWTLMNEKRGGHIPGAINFPLTWTEFKFEYPEFLKAKNITAGKEIILYGYGNSDCNQMAEVLSHSGINKIHIYDHFVDEWTADTELLLVKAPNYHFLVYPQWVNALQQGENPPTFENKKFVICHAHYDNIDDYHQGHIPGAIALNTLELESSDGWNCRTPEELKKNLLKHGITSDTTVILYGRFSYPRNEDAFPGKRAGQLAAMRCAAIMLYAGVKDIRILNGSILAWEKAGYELSKQTFLPSPENNFGANIPAHPEYIIGLDKAKELLASDKGELVCVRSYDEYLGKVSGYNYIEKKGRIPGAVFGNCGSDAYHMENYRNPDLTMRASEEVAANWKESAITPGKYIAFYCGTGWRGSEAFLNAYVMGWAGISVYDGGWLEWSNNPDNPVINSSLNN